MLGLLLRKINKNRWIVLCLLAGLILAIALITAVPMYSRGILQRVLTKQLDEVLVNQKVFPGAYTVTRDLGSNDQEDRLITYKTMTDQINKLVEQLPLPSLTKNVMLKADSFFAKPANGEEEKSVRGSVSITSVSGMEDHVKIINGRLFSDKKTENGEYEVIVSERAMKYLNLVLGKTYTVWNYQINGATDFKVKVVGVYTFKDDKDPFWYHASWEHADSFIMHHSLFTTEFLGTETVLLNKIQWFYALDYRFVDLRNTKNLISLIDSHQVRLSYYNNTSLNFSCLDTLKKYIEKESQLKIILWVFQIPVLIMIMFYISMISGLIIELDKDEIAVIKSRGGSRITILAIYFLESVLISIVGILAGPWLGFYLCKFLGSSNGFLKFVNRAPLDITLSPGEYIYSLAAAAVFIIAIMAPVLSVSKTSIVQYKQKKSRKTGKPFWMKFYFDILFMFLAVYGFYNYKDRQSILNIAGIKAQDIPVDPILYLISTFMILGIGLIFLRIYPYIIKIIFTLGKNKWPSQIYASMINVGRSRGKDTFLMLFLIMTISIGIFNVKAATTINAGNENKIRYLTGADITIRPWWTSTVAEVKPSEDGDKNDNKKPRTPTIYVEPPFEPYTKLKGVEAATKVFRTEDCNFILGGNSSAPVYLMGIIPNEFGKVAWFQPNLMQVHWYNYLNLLAKEPKALLLSKSLQKEYNLRLGDIIYFKWGYNLLVEGYVYAFVDYWPSYNPNGKTTNDLIVANLSYLQKMMPKEPYEIWLKKTPEATSEQIYKSINDSKLSVEHITDANQEVIFQKNDPVLQGTNGALTLCFLSTMIITGMGFLIYWILSIKNRVLQFGILRSMGLSLRKLIGMLISEQILMSGVAILIGIVIGAVSSSLSLPLLGIVSNPQEQILPVNSISYFRDYIQMSLLLGTLLLGGFIILGRFASKIKMDQAIKLGED